MTEAIIKKDSNLILIKTNGCFRDGHRGVPFHFSNFTTAGIRPLTAMYQRGNPSFPDIGPGLPLCFLRSEGPAKDKITVWYLLDGILIAASLLIGGYILTTGVGGH